MNRKILLLLVVVTAVYSQCTVNKAGCDICNSATPPNVLIAMEQETSSHGLFLPLVGNAFANLDTN